MQTDRSHVKRRAFQKNVVRSVQNAVVYGKNVARFVFPAPLERLYSGAKHSKTTFTTFYLRPYTVLTMCHWRCTSAQSMWLGAIASKSSS